MTKTGARLRDSRLEGHGRWAFMVRRDIPDLLDPTDVYITRWRLVATPWGSVYLHRLWRDDNDRVLHDHPWSFASVILRGGYDEDWAPGAVTAEACARFPQFGYAHPRSWRMGSFHRIRRGEFHSIRRLHRTPTWTLLFVGPRRGTWGYATENGWVRFDEYHARRRAEEKLHAFARDVTEESA